MPRSPSRDRSDRFAGRRGYFRRLDTLGRLKVLLVTLAAVAVAGWAAADAIWPKETQAAHTHGELADPHAPLDTRCEECHKPFGGGNGSPFAASTRWRAFDCTKCHAGAPHHAPPGAADAAAHSDCGSCHHDHKGRSGLLTRVTDSHCTGCHRDLTRHPAESPGHPPPRSPVTNFATDHPDFTSLEVQPARTLKFSHALHMSAGLSYTAEGKEALTSERVKRLYGETGAKRYTAFENGKLQLACRDCHQPDAGGKHHTPVGYEASCKTCHPTRVPPGVAGGREVKGFPIPHGRPWADTKEEVAAGYLRQLIREDRLPLPPPDGPGGRTEKEREKQAEQLRDQVKRLSDGAVTGLLDGQGCAKCHDTNVNEVLPTPARTVWLPKARFDHTPHLFVTCQSCHPGAAGSFAPNGRPQEKEPLQLLGVQSCRTCHAPKGSSPTGGVKHGCTTCHSYHHGGQTPAAPTELRGLLGK